MNRNEGPMDGAQRGVGLRVGGGRWVWVGQVKVVVGKNETTVFEYQ